MKHYHFNYITSTNDYAKELLKEVDNVVITADFQTDGRGRKERVWEGDFGSNVFLTYGLNHKTNPDYTNLILFQAVGCLAVIKALEEITKSNIFRLKYPNDIYAYSIDSYKKISGVLIEHSFMGSECRTSLIGIGINVNQTKFSEEIKNFATSLKLLQYDITTDNLVFAVVENIKKLIVLNNDILFDLWDKKLDIKGKLISLNGSDSQFKAEKLLNDGRVLIINLDTNEERIIDDGDTIRYSFDK